jgi:hypothetical protein
MTTTPPPIAWVRQFTQANTPATEQDPTIAVDSMGNTYVVYGTGGTVSGGVNSGATDIVICKVDTYGNLVWVKQQPTFNTAESEGAPHITIDKDDRLIIAYMSSGTIPGGTNIGSSDVVVMKMDTNGNIIWIKEQSAHNTTAFDYAPEVATDISANIYVTYRTSGTVTGQTDTGGDDIVLFKLTPAGDLSWVVQNSFFNTTLDDDFPKIAVDAMGNSYVGYFTRGTPTGETHTGVGTNDIVLFKYDTYGNSEWVKQQPTFNTPLEDTRPSLAVDASGNLIVTYQTSGTISGGTASGGNDIVVMKMDSAANILWAKQNPAFNTTQSDNFPSIALDTSDNIYISYYTTGTVPGQEFAGGFSDIVVFSLDGSGTLRWVQQRPAFNTTEGWSYTPRIALDKTGGIYVTYYTQGAIPGGVNSGGYDIVIFKLGVGNEFCGFVNPYLTLDTTLVYNRETIDRLVAEGSGAVLPTVKRVSWAPLGVPARSLLRNLGKTYVVPVSKKNATHAYVFRSVQLISGVGSEGVGGSPTDIDPWQTGYICVWSASGEAPIF